MAMKGFETIVLILVAVLVLHTVGVVNFAAIAGVEDGEAGVTVVKVDVGEKACGSTTMTVDFSEKYSVGTSMTAYNATVYLNGGIKGIFSEGGTFTAQGKDELNVYYALDPASNDYYASHASGEVPCTGQTAAFMTSAILGKGSLAGALQTPPEHIYKSQTAATVIVYNEETNAVLTSTALAIGAGGTETAKAVIKWDFEEGYGVADGNTLACRFTDSQIDQGELIASIGGVALTTPAKYVPSGTRFVLSAANESTKTWDFPAIDGKVTTSTSLLMRVKGDDNNQPTARTNVSCAIIDTDLFELDAGGVARGIEDSDDNSNVGRSSEVLIHIPVS